VASQAVQPLVQLRRGAFDASRVRALPRGDDYWLVIDRVSGRWLTLETQFMPLLSLIGARPPELPPHVREQVASLRGILEQHAVGIAGSERRFGGLNTVILKLTNACNFACAYCYDYEAFERATTLPLPLASRALEQALDLVADELWVILHGGEPMLQWQLVESLVVAGERLAATRGKRINFVGQSNLSRLNDRVVEFSREHDIVWGVSVDGVPEVHDHFRTDHKGRGTYDSFADALQRYPEFVRSCGVMSTITAANQSRLLECARHFHALGMPSWDWSLFQPIGRGRASAHQFLPDTEALVEAWDELFVAVESGEFDGFPVLPIKKYLQNFIAGPSGNMCMRPECGAARDLLSISANGTIEACDCIDPTGPLAHLGDLHTTTLADARESPVAQSIRGRDLTKSPCAECLWFGVCGGSCLAHAPSLNEVWADGCAVAMRAFDRISDSLVRSDRLVQYLTSVAHPAPMP
jgi:uncharacterized protein